MTVSRHQPAPIIAVINLKGGVGKTHTVWSLLGVCQELGYRALAVDTDTQANLTRSLVAENPDRPDISMLFDPGADPDDVTLIVESKFGNIDVLPSSQNLARHDATSRDTWEDSDLHLNLAEYLREFRVLCRCQFLIPEKDHHVVNQGSPDLCCGFFAQRLRQVYAVEFGADCTAQRLRREMLEPWLLT